MSEEEKTAARESLCYRLWKMRYIDGLSFPEIAVAEGKSVGFVFEAVSAGAKIVGKWRAAQNQESDFNVAMGRLEFLWSTSKQWYEKGNAKHGAIMAKVADMHHEICGLKKFEIRALHSLPPADVLDRVKQATAMLVSPLVAEKMAKVEDRREAA